MTTSGTPRPRQRITAARPSYPPNQRFEVEREIDEQTALGEVYVRSLMRTQLRLAIGVIGTIALTLGMLPLVFYVLPSTGRADIGGIAVPWLVLGFLVYPALIAVAVFYVRQAERNEREFGELVNRR